jgi:GH15 family glucan-1,4-alpha-glucosidase
MPDASTTRRAGAGAPHPIDDYALIGDCRSAALIARDGSIDWLCWPRFDSASLFAKLLDAEQGGHFRIRPSGAFRTERRYLPDTNVLETVFHARSGSVALRDVMPVRSEDDKRESLAPEHEVLRELEGLAGDLVLEIHYAPCPDFARMTPRLEARGAFGLFCPTGRGIAVLRSDVPLEISPDQRTAGARVQIRAGERRYLSLSYSEEGPAVMPPLGPAAHERMVRSVTWWREWAARCTYDGPHRAEVVRSALVLKLMTYAPSGAIVAAPTTSLPERIGGERNWDYRYCWLRDASFTLRALLGLGYHAEAQAFFSWILHATRLTWPELQVVYSIFGEARLPERELLHLSGYAGSRPVRTGNDAHGQLQLDVYGEVLDASVRYARSGGHFDRDARQMLAGLGRTVIKRWRTPDEGIWEGRSGRSHHTYSMALCWVALARLIELHERSGLEVDVELLRAEQGQIRAEVETHGYNEQIQSYVQIFDGDQLDASLLTLPLYGYVDAAHPRMAATRARIQAQLASGPLVYRYAEGSADGLSPGEGAFGICGFWAIESTALGGDLSGAVQAFDQLLGYGNDLGLFAEEIDPATGGGLGNFPQAFTHVGLINAALTLKECGYGAGVGQPYTEVQEEKR